MNQETNLSLCHRDIRLNTVVRIPRHLTHPLKGVIEQAVVSSSHERTFIPIRGTPLSIFGCLKRVTDGNAYVFVGVKPGEETEQLEVGSILYSGVVSCRLSTSPLAWRHLAQGYLDVLLGASPYQRFSSLPMMPREVPWFCGFSSTLTRHLSAEEHNAVIVTARLAALFLFAKCEEGAGILESEGRFPELDEALYPELQQWDAAS